MGLVREADALSEEFVNNELIKSYIDNPNITIILFENPPYAETSSFEHQRKGVAKKSSIWKNTYVAKEMKKNVSGFALNDLGNAFIWSAFEYYLRQPTDSYIVYSPVKYWQIQHLINKQFIRGFAFNRRHFHTNIDATTMVALWGNEDNKNLEHFDIESFDIVGNQLIPQDILLIDKIHTIFSKKYYDSRKFNTDSEDGIFIGLDGREADAKLKKSVTPLYNKNIIGYLVVDSSGFDNPDSHASLLVAGRYNGHGFFLREDSFLEKLPMFAASRYITYNRKWTERARIMKSGDGSDDFIRDVNNGSIKPFLLKCLLFTTLETQNHIRTFTGSDGRFYKNELCLDGDTIATKELKNMVRNDMEEKLFKQWKQIIDNAKEAKKYYNENITYGVYQIIKELNKFQKNEKGIPIYEYPELNGNLKTLKTLIKEYYNTDIVPILFKYQFLK
jgi:hypothetical protein